MLIPRTPKQVGATSINLLRTAYNELADDYVKITNHEKMECPYCGEWKLAVGFYLDSRTATGYYPECKECLLEEACDYDKANKKYIDNREKTIKVLHKMDLPFIESAYISATNSVAKATSERSRGLIFNGYMTQIKSLRQYKGLTWKDSVYNASEEEVKESEENAEALVSSKKVKSGQKRFGIGYASEDYVFLENEYQDWVTRYECNTKAQEECFQRLAMKKLEIHKASLSGDSTDKLDATYQQLLNTANVTPRQSASGNMVDAQTFGTLIQKYEETRPLPEIDPDLKDVDKIGLLIDVFFKGHLCKMLGLKNTFANVYEKYMSKYTVEPPKYEEEEDSESTFNRIFGNLDSN